MCSESKEDRKYETEIISPGYQILWTSLAPSFHWFGENLNRGRPRCQPYRKYFTSRQALSTGVKNVFEFWRPVLWSPAFRIDMKISLKFGKLTLVWTFTTWLPTWTRQHFENVQLERFGTFIFWIFWLSVFRGQSLLLSRTDLQMEHLQMRFNFWVTV